MAEVKFGVSDHSCDSKDLGAKSGAVILSFLCSCELVSCYAGTPDPPNDTALADDVNDAGKD